MNKSPKKLVIKRLLKCDRREVFSALTDPVKMAQWFYGMETGQAKVTMDLRPGGEYLIEMFNEEGQNHKPHGTYLENCSSRKISFYLGIGGFRYGQQSHH